MGEHNLPVFDYDKCTGCGLCARQCPQMAIYISSAARAIHLKCNNRDKGRAAMLDCVVSCISCGICAKTCPTQAITLREDINGSKPVINHNKCIECGACVEKCPRHCLHKDAPIAAPKQFEVPTPKENSCANCSLECSSRKH